MSVTTVAYFTPNEARYDAAATHAVPLGVLLVHEPRLVGLPAPGVYEGVLVEVGPFAGRGAARRRLMSAIAAAGKRQPVVVIDRGLSYEEAGALRAAGVTYFPAAREVALKALLKHPLAKPQAQPCANAPATECGGPGVDAPTLAG
ncbi:MAG: hypothetical protein FJ304_02505 [Planctomycetes bacterium]|nr:hypothetical protein [Planctomycetota bacterium]